MNRLDIDGKGPDLTGYTVRLNGTTVHADEIKIALKTDRPAMAKLVLTIDDLRLSADTLAALEIVAQSPPRRER